MILLPGQAVAYGVRHGVELDMPLSRRCRQDGDRAERMARGIQSLYMQCGEGGIETRRFERDGERTVTGEWGQEPGARPLALQQQAAVGRKLTKIDHPAQQVRMRLPLLRARVDLRFLSGRGLKTERCPGIGDGQRADNDASTPI